MDESARKIKGNAKREKKQPDISGAKAGREKEETDYAVFLRTYVRQKSNIHTKQKSIKKIGILMKENFMIYTKG